MPCRVTAAEEEKSDRSMLALLVRVDNLQDGSTRTHAFPRSPVRIGRNALNDLQLDFPFVSQWHGVVQFDESNTVFYDLGSTNGTTVQGQRVQTNEPVPVVRPDMDFVIGKVRLSFGRGQSRPEHSQAPSLRAARVDVSEHTMMADPGHPMLGESSGATMMLDAEAIRAAVARPPGGASLPGPAQQRIHALAPRVAAYRRAWKDLYDSLIAALQNLPAQQVPAALALFLQTYPETAAEPEMKALAESQGVAAGGDGGAATELVTRLAQYFMPHRATPQSPQDFEGFLVRMLWSVEVFSTAYVALRKGQDELNAEMMGYARRGPQPSPLEEATDPRQVIDYLLDWSSPDAEARVAALKGNFAEIMSHQVALLSGMMEGVRKLFAAELSPSTLEAEAEKKQAGGFWVGREAKSWRQYVATHKSLTEEDKELTSAVFGRAFSRAYARALGERGGRGGDGR
jgi:type VI secretion system protein ImpI